jgi:hypothetical protein
LPGGTAGAGSVTSRTQALPFQVCRFTEKELDPSVVAKRVA